MLAGHGGVRVSILLGMNVVVLGGTAHSTPALWSYLVNEARLEGLDVKLVGRDPHRLAAVTRACRLLGSSDANRLRSAVASNGFPAEIFRQANVVLIQIRNGGYAARAFDETFPLAYGVVGDEGLGPGGLSAGIRNWKAIEPALSRISEIAPDAVVLMMSSPVGLLVGASKRRFPHLTLAGICELPWTTLTTTCLAAGIDPAGARFEYFGINHLGWLYGIAGSGRDIAPDVPLKYMRLHEQSATVVDEQRRAERPRGADLDQMSRQAVQVYAKADAVQISEFVERRTTPWYRHAVGPLIAAFAGRDVPGVFFLSVRNEGFDAAYRNDDVLEYAHCAMSGKLQRLQRHQPIPPHMLDVISRFVDYERLAMEAVLSARTEDVVNALRIHPWVQGCANLRQMARDIVNYAHTC